MVIMVQWIRSDFKSCFYVSPQEFDIYGCFEYSKARIHEKPCLLAYAYDESVSADTNIFTSDIIVGKDGKLIIRVVLTSDAVVYLMYKPPELNTPKKIALFGGGTVPANILHTVEVLVRENSTINVQVSVAQTISLLEIYYIWKG